MGSFINLLNRALSLLPKNGGKTQGGLVAMGISMLLGMVGQYLPVQPSQDDINMIMLYGQQALEGISQILAIFGISLFGIGATHKAVKAVDKKDVPMWDR